MSGSGQAMVQRLKGTSMPRTVLLMTALAAVLLCNGCRTHIGDFKAISTKPIDCRGVDFSKLPPGKTLEAVDTRFSGIGATIETVVDKALQEGDGNLLLDASLYQENWRPFIPFVGMHGFSIRGRVVKVPQAEVRETAVSGAE